MYRFRGFAYRSISLKIVLTIFHFANILQKNSIQLEFASRECENTFKYEIRSASILLNTSVDGKINNRGTLRESQIYEKFTLWKINSTQIKLARKKFFPLVNSV